jgi:hypothetical protein
MLTLPLSEGFRKRPPPPSTQAIGLPRSNPTAAVATTRSWLPPWTTGISEPRTATRSRSASRSSCQRAERWTSPGPEAPWRRRHPFRHRSLVYADDAGACASPSGTPATMGNPVPGQALCQRPLACARPNDSPTSATAHMTGRVREQQWGPGPLGDRGQIPTGAHHIQTPWYQRRGSQSRSPRSGLHNCPSSSLEAAHADCLTRLDVALSPTTHADAHHGARVPATERVKPSRHSERYQRQPLPGRGGYCSTLNVAVVLAVVAAGQLSAIRRGKSALGDYLLKRM